MLMYNLCIQIPGHNGEVRCGAVIGGGSKFVTGGFDACCVVWSLDANGRLVKEREIFGNSDFVYSVSAHPNNPHWFVTGSKDRKIFCFDSVSGEKVGEMIGSSEVHSGPICSLTVVGDHLIAAGSWDGSFSIWTSDGDLVFRKEKAGSHAVVVAFSESTGTLITGSQDKALRWWSIESGELVREVIDAHEDIIRSIAVREEFVLTSSNDCCVKLWSSGECLGKILAHSNFIFSVSFGIGGEFLTASEDKSAKVWALEDGGTRIEERQSVSYPGTVWFATQFGGESGGIVTGCSDGIVRFFSSDPQLVANSEELSAYSSLCASAAASDQQEQIDTATVAPESDMNRYRGKKVGEVKMFKDDNNQVFAYQWTSLGGWEKVGLVTGGNAPPKKKGRKFYSGDQYFAQAEYDYVFDVELGENGRMALLPINDTDNPLVSAEKFCARESINKSNVPQIIDFIRTNTSSSSRTDSKSTTNVLNDPTSSSSSSSHFPLLVPFLFKEAKWPQLINKLEQLQVTQLARIDSIGKPLQSGRPLPEFTPSDVSTIFSKLPSSIPLESLFVVFDLWRLLVLDVTVASELFRNADGGSAYLNQACRQLTANVSNNTGLCCARFLCNIFGNSVSKWALMDRIEIVIDALTSGCGTNASKLTQLACASALANISSAISEKKTNVKFITLADQLIDRFDQQIVPQVSDPDVMYRIVVGLGCLSLVDDVRKARVVKVCEKLSATTSQVQTVIKDIV